MALDELREEDRAVLAYRYLFDMSESDMAQALSCAPGTVKSRLSRSLARLRENLARVAPLVVVPINFELWLTHIFPSAAPASASGLATAAHAAVRPDLAAAVLQHISMPTGAGGSGTAGAGERSCLAAARHHRRRRGRRRDRSRGGGWAAAVDLGGARARVRRRPHPSPRWRRCRRPPRLKRRQQSPRAPSCTALTSATHSATSCSNRSGPRLRMCPHRLSRVLTSSRRCRRLGFPSTAPSGPFPARWLSASLREVASTFRPTTSRTFLRRRMRTRW